MDSLTLERLRRGPTRRPLSTPMAYSPKPCSRPHKGPWAGFILSEVERGFRSLKDPLGMRPIWHHAERRVKAHIFVAALAFLIERMLERALKDAGLSLSARSALEALQTLRHVQFRIDGELRSGG